MTYQEVPNDELNDPAPDTRASRRGRHAPPPSGAGRRAVVAFGVTAVGAGAVGVVGAMRRDDGAAKRIALEAAEPEYIYAEPTRGTGTTSTSVQKTTTANTKTPTAKATTSHPTSTTTKTAPRSTGVDSGLAPDRDQSLARAAQKRPGRATKAGAPSSMPNKITGFSLAPGAVTAQTPIGLPVADTTAARVHVLRRAGLGMGAATIARMDAAGGLEPWLIQQLDPKGVDPHEERMASWFPGAFGEPAALKANPNYDGWRAQYSMELLMTARKLFSEREIYEVVVDVFSNLLNVNIPGNDTWEGNQQYVQMIRRHAFGRYEDMLLASAREPAMLKYLNNNESRVENVNENYGRELLELHTLGVTAGYTEADVRDSAKILSGRGVAQNGVFQYEPKNHVTGAVKVLGFTSKNASASGGLAVGDAYLRYLARHRATARTIARKLAVRFVSDLPSQAYVDRLATVYQENGTAILPVLRAILRSNEFWAAKGTKIRRPLEDAAGTVRALGITAKDAGGMGPGAHDQGGVGLRDFNANIKEMGHSPMGWDPPNGYPDVTAAWQSASQMIKRWNMHRMALWGPRGFLSNDAVKKRMAPKPGQTVDQWADHLSRQLLGLPASKNFRRAAATAAGVSGSSPASEVKDWLHVDVVGLIFDSPEFLIR